MTMFEEHQLAGGAIAGNGEALQSLWQHHRRWVAAVLLAHKPRDAELDDLLQDVAMALVKNIHTLKDPASVKPWLRTIAVNTARSEGRRKKVADQAAPVLAESARRFADLRASTEAQQAREEGRRALEAAQTLPPEYREPLLLRAVRGMSYRHIADVMDVPMTTVETRIARARRMLRQELDRTDAETETRAAHGPRMNVGDNES